MEYDACVYLDSKSDDAFGCAIAIDRHEYIWVYPFVHVLVEPSSALFGANSGIEPDVRRSCRKTTKADSRFLRVGHHGFLLYPFHCLEGAIGGGRLECPLIAKPRRPKLSARRVNRSRS